MVSAPFRIRLKHACATLRGRIPLAQILELQLMADANDISNAAADAIPDVSTIGGTVPVTDPASDPAAPAA